jgi:hypothetical protein
MIVALVAVSTAACLVSLLLAEAAARLSYFGWRSLVYFWRYDRASLISERFTQRDPLIGHRFRPNVDDWDKGQRVRTNSLGFRDGEHSLLPAPGTLRIVALGDSVAAGETIAEPQSFPRRVEDLLRARGIPAEVVNLAIPMTGTLQHAAIMLRWGRSYRPALVLYQVHLNDVCDNPEFLDGSQRRWLEKMFALANDPWHERLLQYSFFYDWLRTRKLHRRLVAQTEPVRNLRESRCARRYPFAWELENEGLAELRVAAGDTPVVLVILPFLGYLDGRYPFEDMHRRLAELASGQGFLVLDLLPLLRGRNGMELWVYPSNSHPGVEGHEIIARAIVSFLTTDARLGQRVRALRSAAP